MTNPCYPHACNNSLGGYNCSCTSGYTGNHPTCNGLFLFYYRLLEYCFNTFLFSDIDECKLGTDNCTLLENCTNTIGGFVCSPCPKGYYVTPSGCAGNNSLSIFNYCFFI